jgi:F-box/leucine-rich repeat protein 10/11
MAQMTSADSVGPAAIAGNALLADNSKRGRSKACLDCRKSKVSLSFDLIIDFY